VVVVIKILTSANHDTWQISGSSDPISPDHHKDQAVATTRCVNR